MLLQYLNIYTIDNNNYCLLPILFLMLTLNKAHHTHPGSLWQTDHQNPATKQKQPVASSFKVQTHSQSMCGVRNYPLLLLIFLYTFPPVFCSIVGHLRTGKLSRPLS